MFFLVWVYIPNCIFLCSVCFGEQFLLDSHESEVRKISPSSENVFWAYSLHSESLKEVGRLVRILESDNIKAIDEAIGDAQVQFEILNRNEFIALKRHQLLRSSDPENSYINCYIFCKTGAVTAKIVSL